MRGWLLAVWLCLPGLAWAQSWLSDPAQSRLAFEAHWEGSPVPGEFRRFRVRLQSDPGTGAPTSLAVRVEVPSLATELPDVDAALAEPEWFDFARHPEARYRADDIQPLGRGRHRQVTFAAGNLRTVWRSSRLPAAGGAGSSRAGVARKSRIEAARVYR